MSKAGVDVQLVKSTDRSLMKGSVNIVRLNVSVKPDIPPTILSPELVFREI
jgi:hypothetical protein